MKLFYPYTVALLTGLMLGLMLSSAPAFAEEGKATKEAAKADISWAQCCEQNDNDTDKCQTMKNVTGKKKNTGTKKEPKWLASSCPQPEPKPNTKSEPKPDADK